MKAEEDWRQNTTRCSFCFQNQCGAVRVVSAIPSPLFMPAIAIHPTPNPNSLKFTVEGATIIPSGMLAFSSAAEAGEHELGRALFALDGVTNVFALPQFLTVTKAPAADWNRLVEKIRQIMSNYVAAQ